MDKDRLARSVGVAGMLFLSMTGALFIVFGITGYGIDPVKACLIAAMFSVGMTPFVLHLKRRQ